MIPTTCLPAARVQAALRFLALAVLLVLIGGLATACSGDPEPTAAVMPTAQIPTSTAVPTEPPATPTPTAIPATSTPEPTATPATTPTPTAKLDGPLVSLPEDEAPHETPIEWWYFNGFLWDDLGNEYSFHYVTFQSPSLAAGTPHLLHATLSDHVEERHFAGERPAFAILDPDAPSVDIDANGWVMRGDGEEYSLRFDLGGKLLDLEAASTRDVVLHDSTGLVNVGEAGETYYYSRTRMELAGWLEDGAGLRAVSGSGWMDHQWGDISRVDVGWDWVNLHLDDGSDLMVAVVWKPVDPPVPCAAGPCPIAWDRLAAYATFVAPDGGVTHVPGKGVELAATGAWVSQETAIHYPSGWQLRVEPLAIDLLIEPVLPDAEFDAGAVLPVVYWEGAVTASGHRAGATLEGRGFVELVGYDPGQATADIPNP